ncbi:adenylate/guanylate cyclase domain-containing protein [Azospirillum argentinense]|nr:adenylate/guanylate cyclase domain-containing protein [Azospirillum argentinense]
MAGTDMDLGESQSMPTAAPREASCRPMPAPNAGSTAADSPDGGTALRNGAERKVVTILFADIVESSSMVSGRDPEEADQTLLTILQILTDAVGRYGGTVAQVLGDGIMAVFGAPLCAGGSCAARLPRRAGHRPLGHRFGRVQDANRHQLRRGGGPDH